MKREQKIELLQAIQVGNINLNNIETLPEYDLTAVTGDLSALMFSKCQYSFYLVKSYQCNLTGQIFSDLEVFDLLNERCKYFFGAIPVIEKAGTSLYASQIMFKSISKYEQVQVQFEKNSSGITGQGL